MSLNVDVMIHDKSSILFEFKIDISDNDEFRNDSAIAMLRQVKYISYTRKLLLFLIAFSSTVFLIQFNLKTLM